MGEEGEEGVGEEGEEEERRRMGREELEKYMCGFNLTE